MFLPSLFLFQISVLHVFRSLCQDPRGMLELFINYDMANDRIDLFQRILASLASIAQGSTSEDFNASQKSPGETADLRFLAMQGVVTLTKSLSTIIDAAATAPAPESDGAGIASAGAGVDDEAVAALELAAVSAAAAASPAEVQSPGSGSSSLSLVESYDLRVCMGRRCMYFPTPVCG